jgi:hypothetical protein
MSSDSLDLRIIHPADADEIMCRHSAEANVGLALADVVQNDWRSDRSDRGDIKICILQRRYNRISTLGFRPGGQF